MSLYKKLIQSEVDVDTLSEIVKLAEKAEAHVIETKLRSYYNAQFELGTLGKAATVIRDELRASKEQLRQKLAEEHNNSFMFFTINPKPSVKLEDFLSLLKKSSTKTCFSDYLYVVEQRGNNSATAGTGFHAHMLVRRNLNYKPSKLKSRMMDTFKKTCNVFDDRLFNVKYCNTEWANDKVKYMTHGGKTGDGKDIKQDIDVWWRAKHKIPKFFGNEKISET